MKEERITYPANGETIEAFSVQPQNVTASIIIIHTVWGLDQYTRYVCKRLGKRGFATVAPNLYSHDKQLFTPKNLQQAMASVWNLSLRQRYNREEVSRLLLQKRTPKRIIDLVTTLYDKRFRKEMLANLISCAKNATSTHERVGAIGFSMGGGLAFKLAAEFPELRSCISFCGELPGSRELEKITVPILAIHAGHDELMNSKIPEFVREALKQKKDLTLRIYANAKHEFFNDTSLGAYDKQAAEDSWNITENFLRRTLASN